LSPKAKAVLFAFIGYAAIGAFFGGGAGRRAAKWVTPLPKELAEFQEQVKQVAAELKSKGFDLTLERKDPNDALEKFLEKNPGAVSVAIVRKVEALNRRFDEIKPAFPRYFRKRVRRARKGMVIGAVAGGIMGPAGMAVSEARARRRRKKTRSVRRPGK